MKQPYYQDSHNTIHCLDFRKNELPDEAVQCVVTSPPYWGLRKYSGEQELIWGNWKGAYGLEPTPEMYVQHTIEILREIRRVLRKDGVVFWNIGDSYFGSGQGAWDNPSDEVKEVYIPRVGEIPKKKSRMLKPKDLCLIPFRVAIAAQEAGWWVRSVIIWSKPNPMPESVTDRPTESHEYILMLTKSARYYWDLEAVREPLAEGSWERSLRSELDAHSESRIRNKGTGKHGRANLEGRNIRSVWEFPTHPYPEAHFAVFPEKLPEICIKAGSKTGDLILDPFMGAGTTLWVAKKLNRSAVGYEISEEYCKLALERNRQQVML